jgi:hypothetical protein
MRKSLFNFPSYSHREIRKFQGVTAHVLTPKIGTGNKLTCEPNLAEEYHSAGGFPQSIR